MKKRTKNIIKNILYILKLHVLNKSFLLGFLICVSFFSRYIFGDNNLIEELGEWELNNLFGLKINFSPKTGDSYIVNN